jgi:hypothetical protein
MQVQQLSAMLGMGQPAPGGAQTPMGAQGQTEEPKPEPKTDSLGAEQQSGKRISAPRQRANEATSV